MEVINSYPRGFYILVGLILFSGILSLNELPASVLNFPGYFSCFALYIYGFLHLSQKGLNSNFSRQVAWVVFIFLGVWVYGFCLGLLYGNQFNYIYRNFFGMTLYSLYFIFVINENITPRSIIKTLIVTAKLVVLYSLLNVICHIFFQIEWSGSLPSLIYRYYYLENMPLYYIIFTTSFLSLFCREEKHHELYSFLWVSDIKATMWLIFSLLAMFFALSKGVFLGLACQLLILLGLIFCGFIKLRFSLFRFLFFSILILIFLLFVVEYFHVIFDSSSNGNTDRYEASSRILHDITWFGKGLGALVANSPATDIRTYGFEVSFQNLMHKFGIFSSFLFLAYVYTFILIIKKIKKDIIVGLFALTCMSYMALSIGNPTLFSPIFVLLHIIALWLATTKYHHHLKGA